MDQKLKFVHFIKTSNSNFIYFFKGRSNKIFYGGQNQNALISYGLLYHIQCKNIPFHVSFFGDKVK